VSESNVPQSTSPDAGSPGDADVIRAVDTWLQRAVIGLNLCPFARAPYAQQRVRMRVTRAHDEEGLLTALAEELLLLRGADPSICETTLLIHPDVLGDFFDYNDFLELADDLVRELKLEGELQVASFHPDYMFADTTADAIENYTNRSPYPMLHLLRGESIERAVDSMSDTDDIFRRNIETLRQLGHDGWRKLMKKEAE